MVYNPNIHHRHSIRKKGYDYSQAGLYFITICCQNRACLFGEIKNREILLNYAGQMVKNQWLALPDRFNNVELHQYIVMPNHFLAILEIVVGATLVVAQNDATQNKTIDQNDEIQNKTIAQNNAIRNKTFDQNNAIRNKTFAQNNAIQNKTFDRNDVEQTFNEKGQPQRIAPTPKTIGDMVGAFQSVVTVEYIRGVKQLGWKTFNGKLWQRNYYECIIRNEQSYLNISEYIKNNPAKWADDQFYSK